jgi:hypothetical protein
MNVTNMTYREYMLSALADFFIHKYEENPRAVCEWLNEYDYEELIVIEAVADLRRKLRSELASKNKED